MKAISDSSRRTILELLRPGPLSVNEIGAQLEISQPAVSQHLSTLKAAGLVSVTARGTRRVYAIDRTGLIAIRSYLDGFWDSALDAFRIAADNAAGKGGTE